MKSALLIPLVFSLPLFGDPADEVVTLGDTVCLWHVAISTSQAQSLSDWDVYLTAEGERTIQVIHEKLLGAGDSLGAAVQCGPDVRVQGKHYLKINNQPA